MWDISLLSVPWLPVIAYRWENFAQSLNGITVPDSSESGAMWFSCEKPANIIRIWNHLR